MLLFHQDLEPIPTRSSFLFILILLKDGEYLCNFSLLNAIVVNEVSCCTHKHNYQHEEQKLASVVKTKTHLARLWCPIEL
jgi:hypothetical protein